MKLIGLVALVFATLACTGDPVQSADAGTTDASVASDANVGNDSVADAPGCTSTSDNLVQNASFEIAPDGKLTGWPAATQRKGGAAHCEAWAEVKLPAASTSSPTRFGQEIAVAPPLPKGTKITATAWFRTLDADLTGSLEIRVVGGSYWFIPTTLPADGSWKQYTTEWTLSDGGAETLWVGFESDSRANRTIGIDNVTLALTRP